MQHRKLRLVTLGPLRLEGLAAAGSEINKRPRKLAVLAYLLVANRSVSRDALVEIFWGGQPEDRARHSLSDTISHLRRLLGTDAVVASPAGISVVHDVLDLDVDEFIEATERGDWEAATRLWEGDFLAGVAITGSQSFDEWLQRERARLNAHLAGLCRARCDQLIELNRWDEVALVAARWLDATPDDSRARQFLIRAHAALSDGLTAAGWPAAPTDTNASVAARLDRARQGHRQLIIMLDDERRVPVDPRASLSHVIDRAREAGMTIVRSGLPGATAPLRAITSALVDCPGLLSASPESLRALATLSPALATRFVEPRHESAPVAISEALADALRGVAEEAPVLIAIDRLELADDASLAALGYLLRVLHESPIAFAVSAQGRRADRLVARLRPAVEPADLEIIDRRAPATGWPTPRVRPAVAAGLALVMLSASGFVTARLRNRAPAPAVAIADIEYHGAGDSTAVGGGLPDLLTTSLARVEGMRVISRSRVYEALGPGTMGGGATLRAARSAGAREVVEGALYRRASSLRLEIRRVDAATGAVTSVQAVEDTEPFGLVDRAVAAIAKSYHLDAPRIPGSALRQPSLSARRAYDAGIREFYRGDHVAAAALLRQVLVEDSTFAMAAYYLARITQSPDYLRLAERLSPFADDRDRLVIRYFAAAERGQPVVHAIADSLAARYPLDLDVRAMLASSLGARGDFVGAMRQHALVLASDSLGRTGAIARCPSCDALFGYYTNAALADSFPAAIRTLRLWIADHDNGANWRELAALQMRTGAFDSAEVSLSRAATRDPGFPYDWLRVELLIREQRLDEAFALLGNFRGLAINGGNDQAYIVSARVRCLQGRFPEARRLVESVRRHWAAERAQNTFDLLASGLVDLLAAESPSAEGRRAALRAVATFDSMAAMHSSPPGYTGTLARNRAWALTHVATALWRLNDTARLARLADTLQLLGAQSQYARDQRLHHYARGLLQLIRGRHAESVTELRRAQFSTVETYLAVPLARGLIALGRFDEARHTIDAALRGPFDSQNIYESRTELLTLRDQAIRRGVALARR